MSIRNDRDYGALQLDFDPHEVAQKYQEERSKRLRPDRNGQYVKATGEFQRFREPVGVQNDETREPVVEAVDVVVVGTGFAGLQAAAELTRVGITSVRFIDRAGDVGGVWYWNRYPGAACDTESYSYLPLLEETGYMPTKRFVSGDEIQEHAQRIAKHFSVYDNALFQTSVTKAEWLEEEARWQIETDRGDTVRARYYVLAGGESMSTPKLPGIPGINEFAGHTFHTARWDYDYTGHGEHGNLSALADKRVALIGTGCTSIQVLPPLAEAAQQVVLFQRTPAIVFPRRNEETDHEWADSLKPGWQEERMYNLIAYLAGEVKEAPFEDHGFVDRAHGGKVVAAALHAAAARAGIELSVEETMELTSMIRMEDYRRWLDTVVTDPEKAARLKAYYAEWCKRATFSDDYLQTFNRDNVTLVDCPLGVEEITADGIVGAGVEHKVDAIIFASGFEGANPSVWELVQFPVIGRGGITLAEHWSESWRTMQGTMVAGFPNYMQISLIGTGVSANYLYGSGKQAEHVAWIIRRCMDDGIASFEPTREAEDEWFARVQASQIPPGNDAKAAQKKFREECTPSYFNADGDSTNRKANSNNTYGSPVGFVRELENWRTDGTMSGLKLVAEDPSS